MVETPRAALRAGEIAQHAAFLSFGTNDLTQMTYGLSRDDAGRFMADLRARRACSPRTRSTCLDIEGVGELLRIGAERGRAGARRTSPSSICGEHGGNPEVDRLLPGGGIRLCLLLALPRAGCAACRRTTGADDRCAARRSPNIRR